MQNNFKFKEGDWKCEGCNNVNFAWRTKCNMCRNDRSKFDKEIIDRKYSPRRHNAGFNRSRSRSRSNDRRRDDRRNDRREDRKVDRRDERRIDRRDDKRNRSRSSSLFSSKSPSIQKRHHSLRRDNAPRKERDFNFVSAHSNDRQYPNRRGNGKDHRFRIRNKSKSISNSRSYSRSLSPVNVRQDKPTFDVSGISRISGVHGNISSNIPATIPTLNRVDTLPAESANANPSLNQFSSYDPISPAFQSTDSNQQL
jgi:hypothetical protein